MSLLQEESTRIKACAKVADYSPERTAYEKLSFSLYVNTTAQVSSFGRGGMVGK